jgi:segregation and condensation protein B
MLDKQGVLEAILFSAPEPMPVEKIREAMELDETEFASLLKQYEASLDNAGRGVMLRTVAEGLQLVTRSEAHEVIRRINAPKQYRLSRPTLEVLAIIAYKQPATRAEIEDVRGVKCERSLMTLLDRGLIREVGRKETVGRPILYGTTDTFLAHFNLRNLSELPSPNSFGL